MPNYSIYIICGERQKSIKALKLTFYKYIQIYKKKKNREDKKKKMTLKWIKKYNNKTDLFIAPHSSGANQGQNI